MNRRPWVYLSLALFCRLIVVLFSYLRVNPYSQADTIHYPVHAARIASNLAVGVMPTLNLKNVYDIWGLFLSPFWLLPGPSGLYARVILAAASVVAIYNVYVIGTRYHSRQAGLLATLPLAFYPSFVLVHATLHREAAILLGLTTVLRLLVAAGESVSLRFRVVVSVICLAGTTTLRPENVVLYVLALGVGVGVLVATRYERLKLAAGTSVVASVINVVAFRDVISNGVTYLAGIHRHRARGRTAYLVGVVPDNVFELAALSWIGAGYFYFSPFPWMIHTLSDAVAGVEAFMNLAYGIAAIGGLRYMLRQDTPTTVGLVVSFAVASVLYGVADANVGTAVRHRQMFVWVVYLFGAVYVSERIRLVYE